MLQRTWQESRPAPSADMAVSRDFQIMTEVRIKCQNLFFNLSLSCARVHALPPYLSFSPHSLSHTQMQAGTRIVTNAYRTRSNAGKGAYTHACAQTHILSL